MKAIQIIRKLVVPVLVAAGVVMPAVARADTCELPDSVPNGAPGGVWYSVQITINGANGTHTLWSSAETTLSYGYQYAWFNNEYSDHMVPGTSQNFNVNAEDGSYMYLTEGGVLYLAHGGQWIVAQQLQCFNDTNGWVGAPYTQLMSAYVAGVGVVTLSFVQQGPIG